MLWCENEQIHALETTRRQPLFGDFLLLQFSESFGISFCRRIGVRVHTSEGMDVIARGTSLGAFPGSLIVERHEWHVQSLCKVFSKSKTKAPDDEGI